MTYTVDEHRATFEPFAYAQELKDRAEAAEARAAQAEALAEQRLDEIVNCGKTYAAKCYVITELQRINDELLAERDEARRQLTEAQMAIDMLSKTVVAQDAEIKRLRQKHEDVAEYRAEIARLNQAATA